MALILALLLTIALYGAFPVAYSFLRKGNIRKAHLRNLCIVYGASVYLALFLFAELSSGEASSFFPAVLWTTLWYKACCGILSAAGRLDVSADAAPPEPTPVPDGATFTIQPPKPHPAPEAPVKSHKALRGTPVWSLVVIGVLSLSCCALSFTTFSAHQHIGELEREVESKDSLVSSLRKWNDSLTEKANKYQVKASYFDDLRQALSGGNLGYASSNFHASKSVFFLYAGSDPEEFTLTAHWSGGGTVSTDYRVYSSSSSVAYVDFNEDTWRTSTAMTIYPLDEGVLSVTFSNSVNSQTFKIVVVVTELTPLS